MSDYRYANGYSASSNKKLSYDRLINKIKDARFFETETCQNSRDMSTCPSQGRRSASSPNKLKISSPSLQASSCPITEQYSSTKAFFTKPQDSPRNGYLPTRDVYQNKNVSSPSEATFAVCRGMLLKQLDSFERAADHSPKRASFMPFNVKQQESNDAESDLDSPDPLADYSTEPDEISVYTDDDDLSDYEGDLDEPVHEIVPGPEFKARLSSSFSFPFEPWPSLAAAYEFEPEPAKSPFYDTLMADVQQPVPLRTAYSDSSTLVSERRTSNLTSTATAAEHDTSSLPPPLSFAKFSSPDQSAFPPDPTFAATNPALLSSDLTSWLRDPSTAAPSPSLPPAKTAAFSNRSPSASPTFSASRTEQHTQHNDTSHLSLPSPSPGSSLLHPSHTSDSYFASDTLSLPPSPYFASPSPSIQSPHSERFVSPFPSPYLPPAPTFSQRPPPQADIHPLLRRTSYYEGSAHDPHRDSRESTGSRASGGNWTDDNVSCYGDDEDKFSVGGDVLGDLDGRESRDILRTESRRGMTGQAIGNSTALRRRNAKGRSGMLQRNDTMVSLLGYYGVTKTKELPPLPPLPMEPSGLWAQHKRSSTEPSGGLHDAGLHRRVMSDTVRGYGGTFL